MQSEIKLVRSYVEGLIEKMESFPATEVKRADVFDNWVGELNTLLSILSRLGDHCFYAYDRFSFSRRLYSDDGSIINKRGYVALTMYLDTIKPLLKISQAA